MPGRIESAVRRSREDPNAFARQLFAGLPERYDVLEEALSFGQNRRWRAALVDAVAGSHPRTVLDVATGTGGVALAVARRTGATVVGVDLTPQMLRRGQARIEELGERRVRFAVARAEQLPFDDATFDALSFTYLLRYVADPTATLRELARVVRPGGTVASLEFAVPPRPVWLPAWRMYTRLVLPVAGMVSGGPHWAQVGRFLGPSIEEHYRRFPVERHLLMWREAGMEDVQLRTMSLGGGLVMWARRSDD
jgi:demethylmenaquinone methyltransferase / 2-methoxy-6-polyprenyl-1,4-benzoquinol methylase